MKKIYTLLLFLGLSYSIQAQNMPPYVHSFSNMYLENGAAAGMNRYPVIFLSFHRQQIGHIETPPAHASFAFHTPFHKQQYAFGTNISYFRQGVQETTNAYVTFARRLDFGKESFLQVGISGGFFYNSIYTADLTPDELADPILAAMNRKYRADVRIGAIYQYKNLQLGLSLPRLAPYSALGSDGQRLEQTFKPLENYTLSAAYRINATPDVVIHPMVLYRKYEYQKDPFFEVNAVVNYKDGYWVGGAYRQDYGMFLMAGFKAFNKVSFGYAYKLANNNVNNYGNPAHEIQFGIHLGKKQEQPIRTLPAFTQLTNRTIRVTPAKIDTSIRIEIVRKMLAPPPNPLEMEIGNYLIVGAFRYEQNARKYMNTVIASGHEAKIGFNSNRQFHYVYIYVGDNLEDVRARVRQIRTEKGYENAWIFRITE
ncbi:PorP/SprF family type IX secretion system membrane protein [Cytophagaceae bacterium DM2B3-1]|uniref:PorP/SprF family type IX secretion system membrane protein n=1 Tax=Xanthocytophaga flava TaxID=3048013 RepID=A0ABT7CK34_9BACT|nr:PorP/SprF family type IX secretion system membrane protein [Xanthocytophaga flavus]MDJ1493387.1 PorP/SprF family type IX secretion system membrane protein [Xanthocytophaga flavus]